jgi:hypothetical protein
MEERKRSKGETPFERVRELARQIIAVLKSEIDKRGKVWRETAWLLRLGPRESKPLTALSRTVTLSPWEGQLNILLLNVVTL